MTGAIYADTSLLASLFLSDSNTPSAIKAIATAGRPLVLTQWQEFELENTFQLRLFRKESSRADLQEAHTRLQQDISAGVVIPSALSIDAVLTIARQLTARHSAQFGTRAFDVFHVAAAAVLKASGFLSFDTRQRNLARAAGLRLLAVT